MSSPPLLDTPPLAGAGAERSVLAAPQAHDDLREVATRIREHIVRMCASPEGGHIGGSMSLVEILTVLYFRVLRHDPGFPGLPERDVLLLSKGHGGIGLFAALCEAGYFPPGDLADYSRPGSHFTAHPHPGIPGVEMPSGSLGHGLAVGVGHALAHRLEGSGRRCYVVMGDGELQEGSVWEAASVAAARKLGRLTAIVDRNGLQISGSTESVGALEPLADRWRAFGWRVLEADGHSLGMLERALTAPPLPDRPTVLIAHTVKGKGVAPIEGQARSHYARLGRRQEAQLLKALRAEAGARR
ncbi:transketolase, N-terminal subunit [Streptomyces spiroverticillatus]|uniref:Transketolase, N-terminal subunit n=1 Tax=Streptomyces finlayi TaxID=67296 RepID=A0A918X4G6_9ACTN|nr:transketolase [Streptomyces finlayi]GHA31843.1 transketolase, N-terminal subunit [Streptomyces spiroverticillatus]GHD10868.1 transketolase, N-terminal subunit [Streptomyces finlayi]